MAQGSDQNGTGEAPNDTGRGARESAQPADPSESNESDLEVDEVVRRVARSPTRIPCLEPFCGMRWGKSGRYVIERRVGAGGMGTVYEAQDQLLHRAVALKVFHRFDGDDEEAIRSSVLHEARVAAQVEHERIARVYDVDEHEGSLFVAMEFVRGTTLRHSIKDGRRSPFHALYVAIQIAEGLSELHDKNVVHRDLKPENVMLSKHGQVKLVDFGLARHPVNASAWADHDGQRPSAVSGTPGYLAPEVVEGRRPDPRVDVFALGVIVYELVTGTRPFIANGGLDMVTAMARPPVFSPAQWERDPMSSHPRRRFGASLARGHRLHALAEPGRSFFGRFAGALGAA
ncbi:MAG: serine/threonine-protein kinase [Polyangiaceae bacterium]|jgi:serine/threonine protein kinase